MPDDLFFLRSLIANPDDNDLRLVYADWLEECGDRRSTFMRLEVALHKSKTGECSPEMREQMHEARASLDARWLALVDRPQPGWRIVRTGPPRIYGKAIPAFIHNGSYYLSTVDVYSDGAIYCWGFVDSALFRGKLAQGWVVPQAEVGGTVHIHNLGCARVVETQWDFTPNDIERKVTDIMRELNPSLEGLLDMQGTDIEVRDGIRHGKGAGWGPAKPYRISLEGEEIAGEELPVLEVVADGYRLCHWLIYADGLSQLGYANELLPLETVARMFEEGQLTLDVPAGSWVTLDGLGRFQAGEGGWLVKPGERVREASGLLKELNGGPDARYTCIVALRAYKSDPSMERREDLRRAYEAVPEHLRRYCGDMDSKDGPIRRVISGAEDEDGPE